MYTCAHAYKNRYIKHTHIYSIFFTYHSLLLKMSKPIPTVLKREYGTLKLIYDDIIKLEMILTIII